jgi:hypothetical protein
MRKRIILALAGVAALFSAQPAAAQARSGAGDWSILGAETVAPGADVVHGEVGWPDTSFGWTHGVNPGFDAGAKFSLLYGIENTSESHFGIGFAVPLRWQLARSGKARLLFHIDPGLRLYTFDPAPFGFQFPVGLNVEFATHLPLKIGIGADFNASLFVTGVASPQFFFGPLVGPYVEYHVDRNLAIGFDTRFGAIVDAYSSDTRFVPGLGYVGTDSGTDTRFGFRVQAMVAYHL